MLHTKFQTSGPSVSEEEVFSKYFSMYFYRSNLGPLARGYLGPWGLCLNKLGKEPQGNATYQIQAPEPSSSGEEDF